MKQKFNVKPPLSPRKKVIQVGDGEREWISLGNVAEMGPKREIRLGVDREHVLAIVGKRGTGKSFTLGVLLEGLCTSERQTSISLTSKARATLLFDTLNIFQWMDAPVDQSNSSGHVKEQHLHLTKWGIQPESLDVDLWVPAGFEGHVTARAQTFRIRSWEMEAGDWAALLGVDSVQDIGGQLITTVVEKVSRTGWVNRQGNQVDAEPRYSIADLLDCLTEDATIGADFTPQSIRAIRQRLAFYDTSPLFGPDGTSLEQLLQPGRLSIMLLSGIPDDVRLVVIYLTLRKLLQARARASEAAKALEIGRVETEEDARRYEQAIEGAPPKSWVVIDEAQNVFPSERQTTASETLLRFVREGRNFGLSLAFTTQQPTALDARVMAQVDTFLVHTLTVDRDIKAVLQNLKAREPDHVELLGRQVTLAGALRDLQVGQALFSSTEAERTMFLNVRPRVSVHGGFEG